MWLGDTSDQSGVNEEGVGVVIQCVFVFIMGGLALSD